MKPCTGKILTQMRGQAAGRCQTRTLQSQIRGQEGQEGQLGVAISRDASLYWPDGTVLTEAKQRPSRAIHPHLTAYQVSSGLDDYCTDVGGVGGGGDDGDWLIMADIAGEGRLRVAHNLNAAE